MICPACQTNVNENAKFCSNCGRPLTAAQYTQQWKPLERPREGRKIAGICAAFSQRYGWDPMLVRLILVLLVFCGAGTPIIAYIIAWIVIPNEPYLLPQTTGISHS